MALFWLLLEAGIALLLLLFIVWWTWPRSAAKSKEEGFRDEGGLPHKRRSR